MAAKTTTKKAATSRPVRREGRAAADQGAAQVRPQLAGPVGRAQRRGVTTPKGCQWGPNGSQAFSLAKKHSIG
jgi:hypothetical protein